MKSTKKTKEPSKIKEKQQKIKKNVLKTFRDLCPVKNYHKEREYYILPDGRIMNIFGFQCRDLLVANETEIEMDICSLTSFMRQYAPDFKIISINIPVNCQQQISYFKKKSEKAVNNFHKAMLDKKRAEQEWLETHKLAKDFYLMVFADTYDQYVSLYNTIISCLDTSNNSLIREISYETKQEVQFKLNNKNVTHLNRFDDSSLECNDDINTNLIAQIQPQGNISFKPIDCVRTGTGYETCLEIYDFPPTLSLHWLSSVCDIESAITVIDVHTENVDEIKGNLNRSIQEQNSRVKTFRQVGDQHDAATESEQLLRMYDDISNQKKILKSVIIRIYVFSKTQSELEKKVSEIQTSLDSYKAAVFLNEQYYAYKAMYMTYTEQQQLPNKREGQPLIDEAIAAGNPFHYSSLSDPNGSYLGTTFSGGVVNFYLFFKDNVRKYYNALITGDMGSGKSTLLKKIGFDSFIRGDFLRVFDPNNEWYGLAPYIGAKIINMDGTDGLINMFEILKTDEEDGISFIRHQSKLNINYSLLSQTNDTQELITFEKLVGNMYESLGINTPGLPAKVYPTVSTFIEYVQNQIDNYVINDNPTKAELDKLELIRMNNVLRNFERIKRTYGAIFDGPTSIDNITSLQCVIFNIKTLFSYPPEIVNVVLYNLLSLCWDGCTQNGQMMKRLYEDGKIDTDDIVRFLIEFDEFHRVVNSNNLVAIIQIALMLREMRKYFGGMVMSTQRIKDLLPDGTTSKEAEQIAALFEFCNYKFIGHQDQNSVDTLVKAFGKSLTEAELDKIPKLTQGEFILNIAGTNNLNLRVYVDEEELSVFKGGM